MNTILVQLRDEKWTTEALHYACATARETNAEIVLVKFTPVTNPAMLGMAIATHGLSMHEYNALHTYAEIAERYDVTIVFETMQYMTLSDAIVEMANNLDVAMVIAELPESKIPYWHKLAVRSFKHHLGKREWVTLKPVPTETKWVPSFSH
jgi:nucleotide-binding universal stress UspA family protein